MREAEGFTSLTSDDSVEEAMTSFWPATRVVERVWELG